MTTSCYCSACDENWPNSYKYKKCPGCGGEPAVMPMTAMSVGEAEQKATDMALARDRRKAFEEFCAERDKPIIDAEVAKFREVLDALPGVPV